jgi:hypothetical protein
MILSAFFLGGVVGALGFKHLGYAFTLPLALLLFGLGLRPVWYDMPALALVAAPARAAPGRSLRTCAGRIGRIARMGGKQAGRCVLRAIQPGQQACRQTR